ncbi:MAG: hypothetical protein A3F84_03060 [Candidatus Handelsmanbacteria bacterium RIFCSPLOWO2_12_FULL_64_10]|uniref:inorganic diphosphatase n=1 Tax=Handelsmanbacteria sp. (strain RIFCSPLOWO2_12_FULL_64_10) TaxID=1817868 RepID=A0A1F6C824_HANXR|nr:MAG: hypothetical protein A3F84_03060 [Candidatus Handelsmanbacteria bacterium RIFCSPLOWO2_12_FULL_64_10]
MIKVFIQDEAGSYDRNLHNEKTLEYKSTFRISRPYPYPYGFIIGTSAEDKDNVDCYVITNERLKTGTIVECEPIGLLEQVEDGEVDHKILAVIPGEDSELGEGLLEVFRDFISHVLGKRASVGRLLPREAALRHIQAFRDA